MASATLPAGATVLVVSKGDDDLLALDGLRAWHFPQTEDGVFAGHYPADSAGAIGHLEALRDKGASFLLIPEPAMWWLSYYDGLRDYLERRCRLVIDAGGICRLYALDDDRAPDATLAVSAASSHGGV